MAFPLLFTVGVDPKLWRPIVGIGAYDLPTFEIDGKAHTFGLQVVGFDSSVKGNIGAVGENWYVTGTVFVWLNAHSDQTTGSVFSPSRTLYKHI
jgi:hypothetical protein